MTHTASPPRPSGLSPAVGRTFVAALELDLARNGKRVITALRRKRPDEYLRIIMSLLPTAPKDASAPKDAPAPKARARMRRHDRGGVPLQQHRRSKRLVTAKRLRALLDYAPDTGRFFWRMRRGPAAKGAGAGHRTAQGYRVIGIDGVHYLAHRLAWLHVHGKHPPDEIDHINGDPTDDRIANLRPCSRQENARNVSGGRTSRFKGVYRRNGRTPRWVAHIRLDGKQRYLGSFASDEAAWAAYKAAALRHYGKFARVDAPAFLYAADSTAGSQPVPPLPAPAPCAGSGETT